MKILQKGLYKYRIFIKFMDNKIYKNYLIFNKNFYLVYYNSDKHNCWQYRKN